MFNWQWDANHIVGALAILLLAWWVLGRELNRRRTQVLIAAIRAVLPTVGQGGDFRPMGSSAFQISLQQPQAPLISVTLLCLLEAREFPLVQVWTRLRGRYDQLILRCDFARPPKQERKARPAGIERLALCALQPASPHLQISFAVPPGHEEQIGRAFAAAVQLAREAAG